MKFEAATNFLNEVDSNGRLNDIQRSIVRDLVRDIDQATAMKAVKAVYLERSQFDIPHFRMALEALARAATAGVMPWHLELCKRCSGTGWEDLAELDRFGNPQVQRCTAGPRITRQQWAEWEAGQAARDQAWEDRKNQRLRPLAS